MSSSKGKQDDDDPVGATGGDEGKEQEGDKNDDIEDQSPITILARLLAQIGLQPRLEDKEKPEQLLDEVTFEGVAKFIKDQEHRKRIIVMTGAGISTAAGIPDFRSPGTGLYDNLQKYDLPHPQAIFEIDFFRCNPNPFFELAKEIYPGNFKPTVSHYFIKLLDDKGLLLRNYTQNVDTLERIAGIPESKIVEAHGSFHTAHCLDCGKEYSHEWVRDEVFASKIPRCTRPECEGVVKPDIVFFGESLPDRFQNLVAGVVIQTFHKGIPITVYSHAQKTVDTRKVYIMLLCYKEKGNQDMSACDLLIVMGTSLLVHPFASLVDRVPETTPRLLINKEKCGHQSSRNYLKVVDKMRKMWRSGKKVDFFSLGSGFLFDSKENYRDVMWQGTTDDGCVALADLLGWKEELLNLVETEHKRIDAATNAATPSPAGKPGTQNHSDRDDQKDSASNSSEGKTSSSTNNH